MHRKVSAESLDLFSCLHQGDGGGGGDGREQRVRNGQEQVKSGRKPVKWMVPRNGPDTTSNLCFKVSKFGDGGRLQSNWRN